MKTIFVLVLSLLPILFSAGCANGGVDRDFRSKVKSSTTTVSGNYDPKNQAGGGTITNTLEFRDPRSDK